MQQSYLAIDIGASSGRHVLGRVENGKLVLKEVYRFENRLVEKNGHLCWDYDALFSHILEGMRAAGAQGEAPASVGIDTWGVDFVLLDEAGRALGDAVSYRDGRTEGMPEHIDALIGDAVLYAHTGIQKMAFNTIYQLQALKEESPELLARAKRLLFTPEYLSWRLTGKPVSEYTIASTSALLNAHTRDWDGELIARMGLDRSLFGPLVPPGTAAGHLAPGIAAAVGYDCEVILPPAHDTASAVLAVPMEEDAIYLSSGTWSLIGVERGEPDCSEAARRANFTNEGGWGGTYRFLKNITGLWILQCVRRELGEEHSFAALTDAAWAAEERYTGTLDVTDPALLTPEDMIGKVRANCARRGESVPETPGELALCICRGLAACYAQAVREIEALTGKQYSTLHIVGGGSRNTLLNTLTARATGLHVLAGPQEGTAIGNLLAQMLRFGALEDVRAARALVRRSFEMESYQS